ncbi:MAG: FAD-dependent oxidoreductase [Acidobacteriota bacterium]
MSKHVIIVGGGIAGLAAGIILARSGRTVTIFERRRYLGGRAVTHLRHGFRFNLGPHAFYRGGSGWEVLRQLGVPVRGGRPKPKGIALRGGEEHKFPGRAWSVLTTSLFGFKGKLEAAKLLFRIRRIDAKRYAAMTVNEWVDANASDERVHEALHALFRLATYCNRPDLQSAGAALRHLRLAIRGVIYVDEGWQKIVDALHSSAVAAGVNFVTSSRVVGVDIVDGGVRGIELGGLEIETSKDTLTAVALPDLTDDERGTRLPADTVILAVDPATAKELVPALDTPKLTPVVASCLDVALSRLPNRDRLFALGIDRPIYYSVHSAYAQLTPSGGALIHVAKYGGDAAAEPELERVLDEMQPGWRDLVVHRRFLPSMVVSNAIAEPSREGATRRPTPVTSIRGLYLAGDWVGDDGMLSDAALSSARAAAKAIIAE